MPNERRTNPPLGSLLATWSPGAWFAICLPALLNWPAAFSSLRDNYFPVEIAFPFPLRDNYFLFEIAFPFSLRLYGFSFYVFWCFVFHNVFSRALVFRNYNIWLSLDLSISTCDDSFADNYSTILLSNRQLDAFPYRMFCIWKPLMLRIKGSFSPYALGFRDCFFLSPPSLRLFLQCVLMSCFSKMLFRVP